VITSRDITKGFDILLDNLPDLILDTPEAPHILGNFVARAVADDCVPPKYAMDFEERDINDLAKEALTVAQTLLSMHDG
jgi:programmed cell death protein 4